MQSLREAEGQNSGLRRHGYEYAGAAVLVLVLWGLTVASFIEPSLLSFSQSRIFNVAVTTASLLVSLGAAYFVLLEFMLYGRVASLLVGTAFLLFAIANGSMGLVPILEGWQQQENFVPYAWAGQRVLGAVLLVAAPLYLRREIPVMRRRSVIVACAGATVFLSAGITSWVSQASGAEPAPAVQTTVEIVACILLFGAAILFWRIPRGERSPWFLGLALALTVAGFAELQYAVHHYDASAAKLGDVLRLVFYTGILVILGGAGGQGYRRLRWQARELSAVQSLMTPPSVQDVKAVIQHVVDIAGQTFRARAQVILSGREDQGIENHVPLGILTLGNRSTSSSTEVQTLLLGGSEQSEGRSVVAVPLRGDGRQFGMLVIDRPEHADFSPEDIHLLRAFGMQASVLLERSLLYEEVAAGAVVEERARLAREIHDGLAQHLAFLKMRVAWLKRSPAALDVGQLSDLESVLETALTEARTAITTLRAEPEGTSTAEAISGYATEFGQVSGLTVHVDADDDIPEVGPKARVELMRVVQEALNNVRKHANAENVIVRIAHEREGVEVCVHDDGAGFSLKQELQGHFGMDIMNERAQSIGGELEVTSAPQRGTRVRVWVPVSETVETQAATWPA